MSRSTVRLGNGKLDARFTELHRVNLSPENRFEASPLRREFDGRRELSATTLASQGIDKNLAKLALKDGPARSFEAREGALMSALGDSGHAPVVVAFGF